MDAVFASFSNFAKNTIDIAQLICRVMQETASQIQTEGGWILNVRKNQQTTKRLGKSLND
jgi:hypothetical protein